MTSCCIPGCGAEKCGAEKCGAEKCGAEKCARDIHKKSFPPRTTTLVFCAANIIAHAPLVKQFFIIPPGFSFLLQQFPVDKEADSSHYGARIKRTYESNLKGAKMASLWDKIAQDVQAGVLTLSEKTGEWLKLGAEALRGGMETASNKAAQASKLAKLKWEQNLLQREIEKAFTALGGQAYELYVQGKLGELEKAGQEKFEHLRKLEAELEAKEQEIENLPKIFATEAHAPDLQSDLERNGGALTQVTIGAHSPAAHRPLKEVGLPSDLVVGMILRGEEIVIANAETVLLPGDRITLLGKKEAVQQALTMLAENTKAV